MTEIPHNKGETFMHIKQLAVPCRGINTQCNNEDNINASHGILKYEEGQWCSRFCYSGKYYSDGSLPFPFVTDDENTMHWTPVLTKPNTEKFDTLKFQRLKQQNGRDHK
jgi:hypothetical protein